jgi:hypothetical protein
LRRGISVANDETQVRQVALLVAVNELGVTPSSSAQEDAARLAAQFQRRSGFEVYQKLGAEVTPASIGKLLQHIGAMRPARLVLYYAGAAGAKEGKIYLGSPSETGEPAEIGLEWLTAQVSAQHGIRQALVFIDAPRRAVTNTPVASDWTAPLMGIAATANSRVNVIFGCAARQFCWETTEGERVGLFAASLSAVLSRHAGRGEVDGLLYQIEREMEVQRHVMQAPAPQTPVRVSMDDASQFVPPASGGAATRHSMGKRLPLALVAGLGTIALLIALTRQNPSAPLAPTPVKPNAPDNSSLPVESSRPAAKVASFLISPPTVTSGDAATLTWLTHHATSATIDPDVGPVKGSGSRVVHPKSTTEYRLLASGPGGDDIAKVAVRVKAAEVIPPPPPPPAPRPSRPIDPGPPKYRLTVYADTPLEEGQKIPITDPRLRNLGFAVRYSGPQPPPNHVVRVEWWFDGVRYSPFNFDLGDVSFAAPHQYNNVIHDPGRFEVRLLIDQESRDVFKFEVTR